MRRRRRAASLRSSIPRAAAGLRVRLPSTPRRARAARPARVRPRPGPHRRARASADSRRARTSAPRSRAAWVVLGPRRPAALTSSSVRSPASGVRSSWLTSAVNRRSRANAACRAALVHRLHGPRARSADLDRQRVPSGPRRCVRRGAVHSRRERDRAEQTTNRRAQNRRTGRLDILGALGEHEQDVCGGLHLGRRAGGSAGRTRGRCGRRAARDRSAGPRRQLARPARRAREHAAVGGPRLGERARHRRQIELEALVLVLGDRRQRARTRHEPRIVLLPRRVAARRCRARARARRARPRPSRRARR